MKIVIIQPHKGGLRVILLNDTFEIHDVPLSWDLNQIKPFLR
jgi:hypothetical protein